MQTSSGLEVTPTEAPLGAQVMGVDFSHPLEREVLLEIRLAAAEHGVLVFPEQHFDDETHIAFAGQLGTPSVHPVEAFAGRGQLLQELRDDADSPPVNDSWHTDVTYLKDPPRYAILRAIVVPDQGGDTEWAHMGIAYDTLPVSLQRAVHNATGLHDARFEINMKRRGIANDAIIAQLEERFPTVRHPAVIEHPVTARKILYVNDAFTVRLEGVQSSDPGDVFESVLAHVRNPRHRFRHHWNTGDVVLWDEITTQHQALADHYPATRVMRRLTIEGDALAS